MACRGEEISKASAAWSVIISINRESAKNKA